MNESEGLRIVVIGASAGGDEALAMLVAGLPESIDACLLIVRHLSPKGSSSFLAERLSGFTKMPCMVATDLATLGAGRIYLAAADHHLLVDAGRIRVTRGARENRWRPAIDPLFRSAAVAHQNRVIGVVLSGFLDDGSSGLASVKRCGGISIVQDPEDAAYPDMPSHALANGPVDYCEPVAQIGGLIGKLVGDLLPPPVGVPRDIAIEAQLATPHVAGIPPVAEVGEPSSQTCPDCGGSLWEIGSDGFSRFRCHTGHSFSPASLISAQTETLWTAMRMFEERRNLLQKYGTRAGSTEERLQETETHIERIKQLLLAERGLPALATEESSEQAGEEGEAG